jgi:hypothetical protein
MKEYPILFSAEMVRAVLLGKKTQTRRTDMRWLNRVPGDVIWVRETWAVGQDWNTVKPSKLPQDLDLHFRADYLTDPIDRPLWRPSIFLPKWASRIKVVVKSVRLEHLQSISEKDCRAEGVTNQDLNAKMAFQGLWERINGENSWQQDPQVAVIEFEMQ